MLTALMIELSTGNKVVDCLDDQLSIRFYRKLDSLCLKFTDDSFLQLLKADTMMYQLVVDNIIPLSISKLHNG